MSALELSGGAFVNRPNCICGLPIRPDAPAIERPTRFGVVSFRCCAGCGSWIQSPRLTAGALADWYDSSEYQGGKGRVGIGYADYERDEPHRKREARARYRRDLAGLLRPGSHVFEIGCASGSLMAELAQHGHSVMGCDLSERFAEMARRVYGLDVAVADWLEAPVADASLDAVLMLGTISNLGELDRSLAAVRRKLKPGGFLFFNFPAADSVVARVYGRAFWMFTPSVMQFMSRAGVSKALASAGFSVTQQRIDLQSPSIAKLLGHARLRVLTPLLRASGLLDRALPVAAPIPGVYKVWARPV
jgi:SAM-dependent methyltransferase